jgi:hypothetical protein
VWLAGRRVAGLLWLVRPDGLFVAGLLCLVGTAEQLVAELLWLVRPAGLFVAGLVRAARLLVGVVWLARLLVR